MLFNVVDCCSFSDTHKSSGADKLLFDAVQSFSDNRLPNETGLPTGCSLLLSFRHLLGT